MYNQAIKSYQNIHKTTSSGRETEARVLTQAAIKLKECQEHWDDPDRNVKLDAALKFNQRIWTIFQSELAKEENPLPVQIKTNLIRLSQFIDKRIFETMAFPEPDKLNILIRINENIAAGLRGSPQGPTE